MHARRIVKDDFARFWSKVDKIGPNGCWLWTGPIGRFGYAQIGIGPVGSRRNRLVHRWAYEDVVGPIPNGLQLDHLCRVRHCVNPDHLEPVTAQENTLRGTSPIAANPGKTHCPHGHEYTKENTYNGANGRTCRTCARAATRAWRAKKTA